MEEGHLKQRLVGAVVLIALAVIFIPMLLNGGNKMEMPLFGSNVPERSDKIKNIEHIDIEEVEKLPLHAINPKRIPIAKGLPEPEIVEEIDTSSLADKIIALTEEEAPSLITKNVWAVQVGSFTKRNNALGLKERLRKKNKHAFVERLMKKGKPVYRVRVGPVPTRKKAAILMKQLKKEFKLKGLVVKHP